MYCVFPLAFFASVIAKRIIYPDEADDPRRMRATQVSFTNQVQIRSTIPPDDPLIYEPVQKRSVELFN